MKRLSSGLKTLAGLALAASLLAGAPQDSRPADPTAYVVWQSTQPLFEHPVTFSRRLAALPKGTQARLLESPESAPAAARPWSRVAVSLAAEETPEERVGWLLCTPRQRRAGELAGGLGGATSPTGLALAAKALVESLENRNREFGGKYPTLEAAFQALEAAWLDPAEVHAFALQGGLRIPSREVR